MVFKTPKILVLPSTFCIENHFSRHSALCHRSLSFYHHHFYHHRSIIPLPSMSICFMMSEDSRPMLSMSSMPERFSRILGQSQCVLTIQCRDHLSSYSISPLSMVPFPSMSSMSKASSAALMKSSPPILIFFPSIFNKPNQNI